MRARRGRGGGEGQKCAPPARASSTQGPLKPKLMLMLPPHLHTTAASQWRSWRTLSLPNASTADHRAQTAHSAVCQRPRPSPRPRSPHHTHYTTRHFFLFPFFPSCAQRRWVAGAPRPLSPLTRACSSTPRSPHTHPRARHLLPPFFHS